MSVVVVALMITIMIATMEIIMARVVIVLVILYATVAFQMPLKGDSVGTIVFDNVNTKTAIYMTTPQFVNNYIGASVKGTFNDKKTTNYTEISELRC